MCINYSNVNILICLNYYRSNGTAKIKFKVPHKDITIVKEFQTTSTLRDIATYIICKVNLSGRYNNCLDYFSIFKKIDLK